MSISIEAASRVIVALDYPDAESARRTIRALAGIPCMMKVGLQLFYAAGPDFVRELKHEG
jgi:orotidine-5'-phosphate decarboxylase